MVTIRIPGLPTGACDPVHGAPPRSTARVWWLATACAFRCRCCQRGAAGDDGA